MGIEWIQEHETILIEWKAKGFAYLWLQSHSCYFYVRMYNWLAYTVIILSSISSATMFSITSSNDDCVPHFSAVQYTIGSLSLIAAILTGVIRHLKPGEMYQQHATIARRYHTLIRSIDTCLSLTSELRPDPSIFIEKIGTELDNLANTQSDPPLYVIKRFEKAFGPLERILYGEDIVELWKIRYQTNRMEQRMFRKNDTNKDEFRSGQHSTAGNSDLSKKNTNVTEQQLENIVVEKDRESPGYANIMIHNINEPFKTSVFLRSNEIYRKQDAPNQIVGPNGLHSV